MRTVVIALILSVMIHSSLSEIPLEDDVSDNAAFIWSGFDHTWQRTIAGFKTPHRIATIANYIDQESHSIDAQGKWSGVAQAHATFTPGVDGDYAYPELIYTGFFSPAVNTHKGSVDFSFVDHASISKDPDAKTSKQMRVIFPTAKNPQDNVAVVLSGFEIHTYCDPSKQPQGHECNSNGTWPYLVNINLDNINTTDSSFEATFDFWRAWTPSKGGGKPFNFDITFTISLGYTVIYGDNANFRATENKPVSVPSTIHKEPVQGVITTNVSNDLPFHIQAITGFGFQLLKTDTFDRLGRYLESLQYIIHDTNTTGSTVSSDFTMAYNAPDTVFPSKDQLWIRTSLLSFDEHVQIGAHQRSNGTICDDGKDVLFKCHDVGLENDTSDQWKIEI